MQRLQSLRDKLLPEGPDGLLVGSSPNRRYLSGFSGSAGWLLITSSDAYLAVDFRYVEQARLQAAGFEIQYISGDIQVWLPGLVKKLGISQLGVEADHVAYSIYQAIASLLKPPCPPSSYYP
jgi:Xaa-Pro aminopeptidase